MNWNRIDADTYLAAVEALAEELGMIASEQELSDMFDEEVAPHVIARYGEDDEAAISQAFADWADSLREDGLLHPEQDRNYSYVGKHS